MKVSTDTQTYKASRTKRARRSKQEMESLCAELYAIVKADPPMTVRQAFYQAVSSGLVDKTENAYGNDVQRNLALMRKRGDLPYGWIADNTRWMRKPRTWSSIDEMLDSASASYRRALWDNQDAYVEVWLEKDALAGVVDRVTSAFDVPLMVSRGFASLSFLYEAAESIADQDKPAYLYYFGDHDPSGVVIDRKISETLRELAPESEIHFERVAVLEDQIREYNLPTRPTKASDSRSRNFEGESVEVDAIPPGLLREMVRDCIVQHVDPRAHEAMKFAEKEERELLRQWMNTVRGKDGKE